MTRAGYPWSSDRSAPVDAQGEQRAMVAHLLVAERGVPVGAVLQRREVTVAGPGRRTGRRGPRAARRSSAAWSTSPPHRRSADRRCAGAARGAGPADRETLRRAGQGEAPATPTAGGRDARRGRRLVDRKAERSGPGSPRGSRKASAAQWAAHRLGRRPGDRAAPPGRHRAPAAPAARRWPAPGLARSAEAPACRATAARPRAQ